MKRTRDDSAGGRPVEASTGKHKRPKSSQACASCRKHKTRCELLDALNSSAVPLRLRCHRCDVLGIPCSFEKDIINPTASGMADLRTYSPPPGASTLGELILDSMPSVKESSSANGDSYSPWRFIKIEGIPDWTAVPMLAMTELAKQQCSPPPSLNLGPTLTIETVISAEQKEHLLAFFETNYAPWLALPPHPIRDDGILDLVRCTVASRHMDPITRSSVAPGLRRLTEESMMQHVFNSTPALATIRAFMILAMWPSVTDSHDSRLIAAAAVNMCSSLGIDKATKIVEQFNARKSAGEELVQAELAELANAEEKERLWVSLHNIESLVCLGTGRAVSSKLATRVENRKLPINVFKTVAQARDCRLGQQARLLDFLDAGLHIRMPEQLNQSDRYFRDVAEILFRLDGLHRQVRSLPVVTSYEPFYFHMMVATYYFSRVLFLMHTLHGLRATFPSQLDVVDHLRLKRNGTNFALNGARDALTSAEALLVTILSLPDDSMLSTAPDSFYGMISLSASLIIAIKFIMLHLRDVRQIPGSTSQLLVKTIERLMQVALFPDHHAMRCARVIQGFIAKWDAHIAKLDGQHPPPSASATNDKPANEHNPPMPNHASPASSSTLPAQIPQGLFGPTTPLAPQMGGSEMFPSFDDFDFLQTNGDGRGGLGLDFWQYFADNPGMSNMQAPPSFA